MPGEAGRRERMDHAPYSGAGSGWRHPAAHRTGVGRDGRRYRPHCSEHGLQTQPAHKPTDLK